MTLELLVCLNAVLLPRMFMLEPDEAMTVPRAASLLLVQAVLVGVLFTWHWPLLVLIGVLSVVAFAEVVATRLGLGHVPMRLAGLAVLLLGADFASGLGGALQWGPLVDRAAGALPVHSQFFATIEMAELRYAAILTLGLLLLAAESNHFIRAALHLFKLEPPLRLVPGAAGGEREIDRKEYNAGRVIGTLERWLMFLVVLYSDNNLNALGFIIAAKGLARFKELDDRDFAEYVLVGTFLSALAALLVVGLVKYVLG